MISRHSDHWTYGVGDPSDSRLLPHAANVSRSPAVVTGGLVVVVSHLEDQSG